MNPFKEFEAYALTLPFWAGMHPDPLYAGSRSSTSPGIRTKRQRAARAATKRQRKARQRQRRNA